MSDFTAGGVELVLPTSDTETAAIAAPTPEAAPKPKADPVELNEDMLTEAERQVVADFSEKIDITNSSQVMQYGATAQRKISDFTDSALANVRTKDFGEVGELISDLVVELKGFDADEEDKGGLFGIFKRASNRISGLKARYDKAEVNIEKITGVLQNHQITLLKDIAVLDQMYEKNQINIKELTMYILAGKKKLAQVRSVELPALAEKAKASGLQEDAQAAKDLADLCERFDKKLHDLELTRIVSIQMVPQIRLVQNNDTVMAEKIQSCLVNTIPLWKSQMVLALGLEHSHQAVQAQREVSDMTNELLRRNAEKLHTASVEIAQETERGIVDLETIQTTNQMLITTLEEVRQIQEDGRQRRRDAEVEIARIEGELKAKLLEINS